MVKIKTFDDFASIFLCDLLNFDFLILVSRRPWLKSCYYFSMMKNDEVDSVLLKALCTATDGLVLKLAVCTKG